MRLHSIRRFLGLYAYRRNGIPPLQKDESRVQRLAPSLLPTRKLVRDSSRSLLLGVLSKSHVGGGYLPLVRVSRFIMVSIGEHVVATSTGSLVRVSAFQ